MRRRRHHNTAGLRQCKRGHTTAQVRRMALRLRRRPLAIHRAPREEETGQLKKGIGKCLHQNTARTARMEYSSKSLSRENQSLVSAQDQTKPPEKEGTFISFTGTFLPPQGQNTIRGLRLPTNGAKMKFVWKTNGARQNDVPNLVHDVNQLSVPIREKEKK